MYDIYDRQSTLTINVPSSVCVVGCGGVGSWVALNMALIGVKKIVLVDNDIIEEHNLNRTPFRLCDVGSYKTEALAEMILERRSDVDVRCINKRIESAYEEVELERPELVIDCRDSVDRLKPSLSRKSKITGGYNGSRITMMINPAYEHIWGEREVRYEITPSWLVPPQLIANIITAYICTYNYNSISEKDVARTFTVEELLENILGIRW